MNKKKQLKNQKRQAKRGAKEKKRKKTSLNIRKQKQLKKKGEIVSEKLKTKKTLYGRIRSFIFFLMQFIKKIFCKVGFHDWKLCSGVQGMPMYTCFRCWKPSNTLWGDGGSSEYYEKKELYEKEIAVPENWEKKEDGYYFKGEYIKMSEESIRKLEVILGKRKDKLFGRKGLGL